MKKADILTLHSPRHFMLTKGAEATASVIRLQNEEVPLLSLRIYPAPDGRTLSTQVTITEESRKTERPPVLFRYQPPEKDKAAMQAVQKAGLELKSWWEKPLTGVVHLKDGKFKVWLEGRLVVQEPVPADATTLEILPGAHSEFDWLEGGEGDPRYTIIPLRHLFSSQKKTDSVEVVKRSGIPIELWNGGEQSLSLKKASWPEWKTDPIPVMEAYDGNESLYFFQDGLGALMQVPNVDYSALWILAKVEETPDTIPAFTFRIGRRNGSGASRESQLLYRDYSATVPTADGWQMIRIPLNASVSQHVEGAVLDLEFTKEIRLARSLPDLARYRWRPLGLPSNVRIAAATLEKSPLSMKISPREAGALFELPQRASYQVVLKNNTPEERSATLLFNSNEALLNKSTIALKPEETRTVDVELDQLSPGYYPLRVELHDLHQMLYSYEGTFGVLPADTRRHRASAPWGMWDFGGKHFTPSDPDAVGSVMKKMGLRYGMFEAPPEARARYGVIKGNDPSVRRRTPEPERAAERYAELLENNPDLAEDFLIFHEDAISAAHATRIPDLFHDRPAYQLNAEEEASFQLLWEIATGAATSMRKAYPKVRLHLGNGGLALREEFYRRGFPKELFDAGGNESASFGRPPETQPPDGIAINAGLWMDRQLLDAYGYTDHPVSLCYEAIYQSTNPGNLSLKTQADYYIRNILHAAYWKMPKIRPGGTADKGNSYFFSNWGGTGFFFTRDNWTPKPSAIAYATLTSVLDGAISSGYYPTGSNTLYLLRFSKSEGEEVVPFWCVRGKRRMAFKLTGGKEHEVEVVQWDGTKHRLPREKDGGYRLTASSTPAYLLLPKGASISGLTLEDPEHPGSDPAGKITRLGGFSASETWQLNTGANLLLEHYNPFTPRRKGNFKVEKLDEWKGKSKVLKIEPLPVSHGKPTMPMYGELLPPEPLALPGKPAEIGAWVHGNSSWGRIIFELEDASGQRWISIGARAKGGSSWVADWIGSEASDAYQPGEIADWNTDDLFGFSRINFDGWRYLSMPLPGQYPGEGYHWPANSQWRWDGDGIVHYPLKLVKLIVELPEKTLYLDRYEPVERPEIFLSDIVSVERSAPYDPDRPKNTIREYDQSWQVTMD